MFTFLSRLPRVGPRLTAVVAWAVVLVAVPAVPAASAQTLRAFDQQVQVDYRGNGTVRMQWTFTPQGFVKFKEMLTRRAYYRNLAGKTFAEKANSPTVPGVVSFLGLNNLPYQVENLTGELNEKDHTFTARFQVAGWAKTRGPRQWYVNLLDNLRWHDPTDLNLPPIAGYLAYNFKGYDPCAATAALEAVAPGYRSRIEITLPAGSRRVDFRKRANGLYALYFEAPKAPAAAEEADGLPEFRVEPRPELVPALHKLYGDPVWGEMYVARVRFANRSRNVVNNFRVRVRVQTTRGRTEWSEWQDLGTSVYPGQEVQAPLHATLDASVCMLENPETARVSVQYQYELPGGKVESRTVLARTRMLGEHDSRYTLLDLSKLSFGDISFYHKFRDAAIMVTALTTANDPAVKELKGKASHLIGGEAPKTDATAKGYLEAVYNLMRANITYVLPTAVEGRNQWLSQHHYLGRDVLRYRSGTCIDLAMLTAATTEASGMESYVVLIPGHAFPAVRLPGSGQLFFVEATGCAGGEMKSSYPFWLAAACGDREYAEAVKNGDLIVINLRFLRQFVPSPELPPEGAGDPLAGLRIPPAKPVVSGAKLVAVRQNVRRDGRQGMEIRVRLEMSQPAGQTSRVYAVLYGPDGFPVRTLKSAYSTPTLVNGQPRFVAASAPLAGAPGTRPSQEVVLFLPYQTMPAASKVHPLRVEIKVWSEEYREWVSLPARLEYRFTPPAVEVPGLRLALTAAALGAGRK